MIKKIQIWVHPDHEPVDREDIGMWKRQISSLEGRTDTILFRTYSGAPKDEHYPDVKLLDEMAQRLLSNLYHRWSGYYESNPTQFRKRFIDPSGEKIPYDPMDLSLICNVKMPIRFEEAFIFGVGECTRIQANFIYSTCKNVISIGTDL